MRAVPALLLGSLTLVATLSAQGGPPRPPAATGAAAFDVTEKSIAELQEAMRAGRLTSRQLVEAYRARILAYDVQGPRLNAIVAVNADALADADALDRERAATGARGPLHGVPVVVKDNYETVGLPTAAGSLALAGYRPSGDAFQVRRLRDAGAVILAKTNMHELAAGITNISSLAGQTKNPYDPGRYPGGSSGGTGTAVAASFAAAGMGSDTCGSIRIPASSNNLVGLRGTRGLASGRGIVPLSRTQDIGGPLARSLADLAVVLDATVGVDPEDPTTAAAAGHVPKTYADALQPGALRGARLGLLKLYFGEDEDGSAVVRRAIERMKTLGAEIVEIDVPGLADLLRDSSLIMMEFTPHLAEFLAARPGAPVHSLDEIVMLGLYDASMQARLKRHLESPRPGSDEYRRALVKRQAITHAVTAALDEHRLAALVYPTMRRQPARFGDPQLGSTCQLSAASGLPALSVPAGFTDDGLPIGVEFLGRAWSEVDLLKLAYEWEQAARLRRAPFSAPPLVNGRAPGPVSFQAANATVRVQFTFDPTTSQLAFAATAPLPGLRVLALHRAGDGGTGPIVARLIEAGATSGTGMLTLAAPDREALASGRLYLQAHTGEPVTAKIGLALPSRPK